MTVILFKLYGYVTCSHGTDCHAELPAGNLRSGVNIFFGSSRKQITEIKREGMIARLPAGSVQRFKMAKIDPVSPYYPGFQRIFFFLSILMVGGEVKSGALSNRKHGLFHIRYFENGPLEPGYFVPHSLIGKSNFAMGKRTRSTKNEFRL